MVGATCLVSTKLVTVLARNWGYGNRRQQRQGKSRRHYCVVLISQRNFLLSP